MSAALFMVVVVVLCWTYDFFNGMNDAANAIATVVASGTLTAGQAIALARTLNLVGAFLTTSVAHTVGQGIVPPELLTQRHLVAALAGAIIWTALCTFYGLPISITHALIGGLIGPLVSVAGASAIMTGGLRATAVAMLLSPVLGFVAGFALMAVVRALTARVVSARRAGVLRWGQLGSASFMALMHGANDTQNAMGIITASLVVTGYLDKFAVPTWVRVGSAAFMALGTWAGGWRVIDTLGRRLVDVDVPRGFSAETGASLVIGGVTAVGIPISTTHVISAAILGTGAQENSSSINWDVATDIVLAWLLTLPGSAFAALVVYWILS